MDGTLRCAAARSDLSAVVGAGAGLSAKRKPPGRRLGRTRSDDDQIIVSASRRLPFTLSKNLVAITNHLGSDPHRVFDPALWGAYRRTVKVISPIEAVVEKPLAAARGAQ
jgi:hypothetical protein